MDMNLLRGIVLVLLILAFVALCVWAFSNKRRASFDRLSRLPLEEDDGRVPQDEEGHRS